MAVTAWTVFFIVVFGILSIIPAVWSVVNRHRGNLALTPAMFAIAFAFALLLITFTGIAINWGDCPVNARDSGTSEDAVRCANAAGYTNCKPDLWLVECRQPFNCPVGTTATPTAAVPLGSPCPRNQFPVYDYCEHAQTGGVKQPWATWSDLSFVAAGLWLFWFFQYFENIGSSRLGRLIIPPTADNPMIQVGWLTIIYGLIVIFMGPPSMWFHASMKEWAGWFDSMSVVAWLFFNACYVWHAIFAAMWGRGRGVSRTITILCMWLGGVVTMGIIGWIFPHARLAFYFISGGSWGLGELLYLILGLACSRVTYRRTWYLFIANLILLGVTMGIWIGFNPNIVSPATCRSDEAFPGHAVFHILASWSTVLTFFSFASEKPNVYEPTSI